MATTVRVPLEVYLSTPYEPDAEYVDGEVQERPMGEKDHAAWQKAILLWFSRHEKEWNIDVYSELRVQISPQNYRVPDVTVLSLDQPDEQIITHPPLAVFEVLSPEDTVRKLMRKLADYSAMGIPNIWSVDPETRIFSRFQEGELVRRQQFKSSGIDFQLDEISKLIR